MADEPSRSISESIRLWSQAVAIPLVLAVAGFWQFYLKEVWWPGAAINLTAELSVKEAGLSAAGNGGKKLEAIELVITARNPSSSTVYLLPNYWAAWGVTVDTPQEGSEKSDDWLEGATELINNRKSLALSKHSKTVETTLVSVGPAILDYYLRPNEKVSATIVFHVPQGLYDFVEVTVWLPTTSRENPDRHGEPALGIDYKLNSDRTDFIIASVYRITSNGAHGEIISTDPQGSLPQKDIEYYNWQLASSTVELSMWQGKSSPPTATEPPKASSP